MTPTEQPRRPSVRCRLGWHRYRHWSTGHKIVGCYVGSMSYGGPPLVCTRCGKGKRLRLGALR